MDWENRKVLVLGLGDTGLSMTRWLRRHGARVRVADTRAEPPHAGTLEAEWPDVPLATGAFEQGLFSNVDAIAISPGIDRRKRPVSEAIARGVPVIGDIGIFAGALSDMTQRTGHARPNILAITGSNGKSTVTSMTGVACGAAGRNAVVAGNIGLPVLEALTEIENGAGLPDVFALELSSFQLESTESLAADAATVLNVTEDHLDRYDGMAAYAAAKSRIFDGAHAQVLNRQDAWSLGMARPDLREVTFGLDGPARESDWGLVGNAVLAHGRTPLMPASDLGVAGLHNAANALAALALGDAIGIPMEPMLEGLRGYRGLPHRLEYVGEIRGITFYDDSKGTNVGATVAALNGMTVPCVLIAGGDGKGQDFGPLAAPVAAHARAVVLIGRDAPAIAAVLAGCGVELIRCAAMQDAVEAAFRAARPGDAVLLSPACASYDMFRSYVYRGQAFVQAVQALAASEGQARGN
jgi:UDP-N-acetylmuramoylalanine--D-glutamate ligase